MPDTFAERIHQPGLRRDAPRRSRRTTRRLVVWLGIMALALAAVIGGLVAWEVMRAKATAQFFATNKPPPAAVIAAEARAEAVPQALPGIGSLAAVHQVVVSPEVGGRVVSIAFQAGATVKKGDPLVQLNDQPDRGDLANYQAQARWAEVSLSRARELASRQYGPQANVDQFQSQLDQANAGIAKTQAVIAQKLVRAPFDGELGVRQIEVGQYLTAGAPIVSLTDLDTLYVNFTLPEQNRGRLSLGQDVRVAVDAYPGQVFEGKVTTIEPQVGADTRAIKLQATLANPKHQLMPGMFTKVNVVLPAILDVVVVPETAVDYTLYGDSVFVLREVEGGAKDAQGRPVLKATRVFVKTGDRFGGKVAILSGVKPGDRVIASGQNKLVSDMPVVVSPTTPLAAPASVPTN
jgi:membrane fusion protein, multidrug efflux system